MPYDYLVNYEECPSKAEGHSLSISGSSYKIIQEKPDLLVVDVWIQTHDTGIDDNGLLYSKAQHGVYTRYRAAVMGSYEITEREPKKLMIKYAEPQ